MTTDITLQVRHSSQHYQHSLFSALLLPLLVAFLLLNTSQLRADESDPVPSVEYPPQAVVKIVIDALQTNSEESGDSGIATVFRFASPGNRSSTGPLERFARMIKGGFADMLNHQGARFDTMEISDDVAVQAVWLLTESGAEVGYAFQLGRQQSGEYAGMWMTDTVVPLGEGPRSGTRI